MRQISSDAALGGGGAFSIGEAPGAPNNGRPPPRKFRRLGAKK